MKITSSRIVGMRHDGRPAAWAIKDDGHRIGTVWHNWQGWISTRFTQCGHASLICESRHAAFRDLVARHAQAVHS